MESRESANFWMGLHAMFQKVCQEFDAQWCVRKRTLNTLFLVVFIFKLVLSKNKQGYNTTLGALWDATTHDTEPHLPQNKPVAASSVCEARQKMPETIFKHLNQGLLTYWQSQHAPRTWQGHRIFAVDGSVVNLPHELIQAGYKVHDETHRHYPMGLMSTLYNLGEGMVYDCTLQAHGDERLCALEHMNALLPGDILVLDRGYFSYWLLHESVAKNLHLVCRMKAGNTNKAIKDFWKSEKMDTIIDYPLSGPTKSRIKKRGYHLLHKAIPLRLVKYRIDNIVYVIATTLVGANYRPESFAELYHGRWGIEELYKISKQHIAVEDFHAKTERGVKQELYAHFLLINIARIFENIAQNNSVEIREKFTLSMDELKNSYWQGFYKDLKKIKINFKNCLSVINRYVESLFLASHSMLSHWIPRALAAIARTRQKIRPGRHYPRCSWKPANKWTKLSGRASARA